jgi:putative phage-type endonuclease
MSALDTILREPKITHDLEQGSDAWHAFRLQHDGASEIAAVLGLSKNVTRNELLHAKHTGLPREFSDFVQERVLDKGHQVEALARPIVEAELGEDLYPVTCSRGRLSASCDGLTLDDGTAFEHKQWNEELAVLVRQGIVPDEHQPQCQQIMLVTGAQRVKFVVSDGTAERMVSAFVTPDSTWWDRIASGWEQFHIDLAAYVPPPAAPVVVAAPVQALPAVTVLVEGSIAIKDNFAVFEVAMRDFLEHRLIREPKTDQDFADLDVQIKAMKGAEAALESAEVQMLAQIQSVDSAKKTKDMLAKLVRDNRLMAEKLLASEKERRRGEIVAGGITALREHVAALNTRLGKAYMPQSCAVADFGGAIKGLRSLTSMEDAVATLLANSKIAANDVADRIDVNLKQLRELARGYETLFADTSTLVLKAPDDCKATITSRISEHKAAEAERLEKERERIRREETERIEREQQAARQAELRREQEASEALQPAPTPAPAAIAAPAPISQATARLLDEAAAGVLATSGLKVVPLGTRAPAAPVAQQPAGDEWQSAETLPKEPTQWIAVQEVVLYRWLPYKPASAEARRGIKGRWQRHNGYGFENSEPPQGLWRIGEVESVAA